jgi:hypothetical protein
MADRWSLPSTDMSADGSPKRVFISYSHDSAAYETAIRDLSDRLREGGLDCHIDQYEVAPSEGWPRWMRRQIDQANFVLIACSETYLRRVDGTENPGVGLGASWEGGIITQDLYESQGRNEKFIPIVLDSAEKANIPLFLRAYTHYDVSNPQDYEKLYRYLTGQPRVIRPKLGSVRPLPPEATQPPKAPQAKPARHDHQSLVLLVSDGRAEFIESTNITSDGTRVQLELAPRALGNTSFLESLRNNDRAQIYVAFGTTAIVARVQSVSQAIQGGMETWSVDLRAEETNYGSYMEMSFNGMSAEKLAEMRAKRILLNEKLPTSSAHDINASMLEVFVRGQSTPIQVTESPLPALYTQLGKDSPAFIPAARLFSVLYLRLSGVVERISRLDLSWERPDHLRVNFKGLRAKKYSNADPAGIEIEGICRLA